jgi:hypothetical protein
MVKVNILTVKIMVGFRRACVALVGMGLAGCVSAPEPPPPPPCPPGQVMTYAAGCVIPDRGGRSAKPEYVPYKPLAAKPSAVSKEKDNNPFNKPGQ